MCTPTTCGSDGTKMHCEKMTSRWRECDALGNVLLGTLGSSRSCGHQLDTSHQPKHRYRPGTPLLGKDSS